MVEASNAFVFSGLNKCPLKKIGNSALITDNFFFFF